MEIKNQAKTQKGQQVINFSEDQAREYFEQRRWPNGPRCVHCESANVYRLGGKSTRPGLFECRDCRQQFTVTVNSVMEDSHLPLATWAKAFHLMVSSKKGISALQLQRNLGIGSYRTAWFLAHRIREAMRFEPLAGKLKGVVEADETYVGGKPRADHGKPGSAKRGRGTKKTPVMVLVERGGSAYSTPLNRVTTRALKTEALPVVDKSATLMTDENTAYRKIGKHFAGGHGVVRHQVNQYVGPNGESTNTAESYFALLKRGHYGTFHQLSKKHLWRYCNEFSFRWNGRALTDAERRDEAVRGAEGKRLMLKAPLGLHDAAGGI